jgi:Ca2+-binding RTX toxin-like protein
VTIERLEHRQVLAAWLEGDTLRVEGYDGVNDSDDSLYGSETIRLEIVIIAEPQGPFGQVMLPVPYVQVTQNLHEPDLPPEITRFHESLVRSIDVRGLGGHDSIFNDTAIPSVLDEGTGSGLVRGGDARDLIYGGSGSDQLSGGAETDFLFGGPGSEDLHGGPGGDFLIGGPGDDDLEGAEGNDVLYGEAGVDRLKGELGNDWLYGGDDDDSLEGGADDDELFGEAGHDTLAGDEGNDRLVGGEGNDTLRGGFGNDSLYGYGGDDHLEGGNDDDTLLGLDGDDVLLGMLGDDRLEGGIGDDGLDGDWGEDTLIGGNGNDTLRGGIGDDVLLGNDGHDNLYGGIGRDWLEGGSDRDGLYGGPDPDTLIGGSGSDRFLIHTDEFGAGDDVRDLTTSGRQDARIEFHNGERTSFCGERFDRGFFVPEEIELIDTALAALHASTDNNRLLRTSTGGDLDIVRHGARLSTDGSVVACNTQLEVREGENRIHLTDNVFQREADGTLDENYAIEIVLHEIGHNWDDENPRWGAFKDLSGWRRSNPRSSLYVQSGNGKWWHLLSASFISNYAKNKPHDDFAESFAAYFMYQLGRAFIDVDPMDIPTTIPEKFEFLDEFVDGLR